MLSKSMAKKRLGEILIDEGCLTAKELEKGLELQKKEGGLIGNLLIRMGAITEEELVAALARQLSLPFIRISNYSVNRAVLKRVPKDVAVSYLLFPFDEDEGTFSIAVTDPLNDEAFEAVKKSVSSHIQVFLSTPAEIKSCIELYYGEPVNQPTRSGEPEVK